MGAANDQLRNAVIAHQIGVRRLSNAHLKELLRILDRSDREVLALIRQRLPEIAELLVQGVDPASGEVIRQLDTWSKRRLLDLYKEIAAKRRQVALLLRARMEEQLAEFAAYEQEYIRRALIGSMPRDVRPFVGELALASDATLTAMVRSSPFQGKLLGQHFADLMAFNAPATRRLKRAIESGLLQGSSVQQIVRKVNAQALGLTRANVAAISHSAIAHVSTAARMDFGEANKEQIGAYQWVGTLDSKICSVCIVRDGHIYDVETLEPLDEGPEWEDGPGGMHYNDRCTLSYVLRSWQELGITRRDLPGAMRASMDGQVSAKISAEDWVNEQGYDRLRDMFGPRRARLLTDGGLDIRDLVREDGTLYTLQQLRSLESAAFEAAGF